MEELVIKATENFTKILATSEIKEKYWFDPVEFDKKIYYYSNYK